MLVKHGKSTRHCLDRFHRKDVLDLQWSKDGSFLISGSVDNSCIIWDAVKGSVHQILNAHLHYVQGVAWDPLSKYVASLSSDRTCRIYANKPQKVKGVERMNYVCQHVISKTEQQTADDAKVTKWEVLALSSQDGYCTLVEFLSDELGSPVSLSDRKTAITPGSGSPKGQKAEEVAVKASLSGSPVIVQKNQTQKTEEMMVETSKNDSFVIVQKSQTDSNAAKQAAMVTTSTPPMTNKPAKRHITPVKQTVILLKKNLSLDHFALASCLSF